MDPNQQLPWTPSLYFLPLSFPVHWSALVQQWADRPGWPEQCSWVFVCWQPPAVIPAGSECSRGATAGQGLQLCWDGPEQSFLQLRKSLWSLCSLQLLAQPAQEWLAGGQFDINAFLFLFHLSYCVALWSESSPNLEVLNLMLWLWERQLISCLTFMKICLLGSFCFVLLFFFNKSFWPCTVRTKSWEMKPRAGSVSGSCIFSLY